MTDWIDVGVDSEMDFEVDPDLYYVIDEDGRISTLIATDAPASENISNEPDVGKLKSKKKRWDEENRTKIEPNCQRVAPSTKVNTEAKKPCKASRKKEQSVDLTSTTHRETLLKTAYQESWSQKWQEK